MNEKELREQFAAHKCANQEEFDLIMSKMNIVQSKLNEPHIDRTFKIQQEISQLEIKINMHKNDILLLRQQKLMEENAQRSINRLFHDLKHQLILENPKDEMMKKPETT